MRECVCGVCRSKTSCFTGDTRSRPSGSGWSRPECLWITVTPNTFAPNPDTPTCTGTQNFPPSPQTHSSASRVLFRSLSHVFFLFIYFRGSEMVFLISLHIRPHRSWLFCVRSDTGCTERTGVVRVPTPTLQHLTVLHWTRHPVPIVCLVQWRPSFCGQES